MTDFRTLSREAIPALQRAMQSIHRHGPRGDYYEFGVYRGGSLLAVYREAVRLGMADGMHFVGLDSFAGLPEPEGIDAGWEFEQGQYAASRLEVQQMLHREAGEDLYRFALVEGFYEQSLTAELYASMHPAALVLFDCDLYSSTRTALGWLTPLLQEGTELLFDDYNCFEADPQRGQRLAWTQWQARNPEWRVEEGEAFGWHGQGFILRRGR